MIDLAQSLTNRDPGFLRIVAGLWGLLPPGSPEIDVATRDHAARDLAEAILHKDLVDRLVERLPADARAALDELAKNGGRLAWPVFARRFGAIREMGAARRDREQPHLRPASTAEVLWYRALISRAFLDTPQGPQEFACIPGDLLELLPPSSAESLASPGRAASAAERAIEIPARDAILDHACTLLAALRLGMDLASPEFVAASWDTANPGLPLPRQLQALLLAAELLDPATGLPIPETSRQFLEMPRAQALALLARAWLQSPAFNDLRQVPGLVFEGDWRNDPLPARRTVLQFLSRVPRNTWWSLAAFTDSIKTAQPDFQRPAGDYDSWYIRGRQSGKFLRGFDHWEDVEGALIHFIITGPLHWLGILDISSDDENHPAAAFRFSKWADALLDGTPPAGLPAEDNTLLVSSDARIRVPRLVPRIARYQLARLCAWEKISPDAHAYRITPASLERAKAQGLKVGHLLALLRKSALAVPPILVKALERWEAQGSEARMEQVLILHVRTPEILQALRGTRAARFLGTVLGPTAVIVNTSARDKVLAALAGLGYLGEGEITEIKTSE